MPEIIVGSVAVTVVPDVQRFAKELAAKILPAADQVGREAGKRIGEGIEDSVNDAVKRSAAKALASAAAQGKAIGARLGENIKAAAEAIRPEVKADIKIDKTAFSSFIAEVKAMHPEVTAKISLDKSSFASFLADIRSMRPEVSVSISANKGSLAAFASEVRALKPEVKVSISLLQSSVAAFIANVRSATSRMFVNLDLKFTQASVAQFRSSVNASLKGITVGIEPKFTQAAIARFRSEVKAALSGMSVYVDVKVNKSSVIAARAEAATLMSSGGNFDASGARAGNAWGGGFFRILMRKIPLFAGFFGNAPLISHISVISLALHILIDALIVLIPAVLTASAGLAAFGAAAYDAGKQVVLQFKNIQIVGDALNRTIPPLTGNLERMHDVVRPQVFQLLGAGLNAAGKNTAIFNTLAVKTGSVLNDMAAKMDVMINNSGPGLVNFLRAGGNDLKQFSSILQSIGHIFAEIIIAGEKTQIAQHLLQGVAVTLSALDSILKAVGPNVIAAAIAFFAFVHYGGLAVTAISWVITKLEFFAFTTIPKAIAAIKAFSLTTFLASPAALIAGLVAVAAALAYLGYQAQQASNRVTVGMDDITKAINNMKPSDALISIPFAIGNIQKQIMSVTQAMKPMKDDFSQGVWGGIKLAVGIGMNALFGFSIAGKQATLDAGKMAATSNYLYHEFLNLGTATMYTMKQGFSFSQSLGILNTAGVKANDTFEIMKQKVDNLIVGYTAMGQKGGAVGADMNALTVIASDQVTSMDKLNQAWDKFIGFLTAPPTTFLAWNSALTTFSENAKVAGASMTSLGAGGAPVKFTPPKVSSAAVALQNQFEQVINAAQASLDALRNSNALGGSNNFTRSVKDMISVLIPLTGGSKAAVAQVSALAQEAGGPATLSIKELARWSGNQGAAKAMADYYNQSNLAVTSTYNLNLDAQNLSKTLQADLIPSMVNSILHASGARQAMDKFASTAIQAHSDITKLYGPGKSLLDALVRSGVSPQSAKSMITGMLQYLKFTPEQIKQFWSGISKGPEKPAPVVPGLKPGKNDWANTITQGKPWKSASASIGNFIPGVLPGKNAWANSITQGKAPVINNNKPFAVNFISIMNGSAVQHFFMVDVPSWTGRAQKNIANWATTGWKSFWSAFISPLSNFFLKTVPHFFTTATQWTVNWSVTGWNHFYSGFITPVSNWFTKSLPHFFTTATQWTVNWAVTGWNHFNSGFVTPLSNFFTKSLSHFFVVAGQWIANWTVTGWNRFNSGFITPVSNWFTKSLSHFFVVAGQWIANWATTGWKHFYSSFITPVSNFFTKTLSHFFVVAGQWIANWATTGWKHFSSAFISPLSNFFTKTLPHFFTTAGQWISNWATTGWNHFYSGFVTPLSNFFTKSVPNFFTTAGKWISNWATTGWNSFNSGFISPLSNWFTQTLPGVLSSSFKTAANKAVAILNAPIKWVNDNVLKNLGIPGIPQIPSFARGGVLPGYAPGRDTVLIHASPGEGILVPEAVKGIGGEKAVNAINHKYAGHRGAGRPGSSNGYATGGIIPNPLPAIASVLGSAINWATSIIKGVTKPIFDKAWSSIVTPVENKIKGSMPGDVLVVGAEKVKSGIDNKLGAKDSAAKATAAAVSTPSGVTASSSGLANLITIAKYLVSKGATKIAAAGIAGDIYGESAGNPESVGSGGFGLIGWTGNTIGLPAGYTGPTGNASQDLAIQMAGVLGYINALGGLGPINAATDVTQAGQIFSANYEKPLVKYSDTRPAVAAQVLTKLAKGGVAPPGWALVGEQGPELAYFRGGGMVLPTEQSMSAMRGFRTHRRGGDGASAWNDEMSDSRALRYLDRIARATESAPAKTGPHVARALNTTSSAAAARSRYATGSGY